MHSCETPPGAQLHFSAVADRRRSASAHRCNIEAARPGEHHTCSFALLRFLSVSTVASYMCCMLLPRTCGEKGRARWLQYMAAVNKDGVSPSSIRPCSLRRLRHFTLWLIQDHSGKRQLSGLAAALRKLCCTSAHFSPLCLAHLLAVILLRGSRQACRTRGVALKPQNLWRGPTLTATWKGQGSFTNSFPAKLKW